MDTEYHRYPALGFNEELGLFIRYHFGAGGAEVISYKAFVEMAQQLVEYHEALADQNVELLDLLAQYDEVDIADMIGAVKDFIHAAGCAVYLYQDYGKRLSSVDEATLQEAYEVWYDAEAKATKSSRKLYELLVGPIPKFELPDIPMELWTETIVQSRFFRTNLMEPLAERYCFPILCAPGYVPRITGAVFRSHKSLQDFFDACLYTANEEGEVFNQYTEKVGNVVRIDMRGEDEWNFTFDRSEIQIR